LTRIRAGILSLVLLTTSLVALVAAASPSAAHPELPHIDCRVRIANLFDCGGTTVDWN
jgi:hypothetical protein